MEKDYGMVSLTSRRKVVSVLELTVWIVVCAVAVFGWSEAMNSNRILPKQYYTLVAVSVAVIVLAVKVLIGKRIRLGFGSMSVVISAICTVEAIYALCQWADWVVPNMTYRITGHFDNPAGLVACLCVGIPFSLYQYGRIPTKVVCICLSIIFLAISISKSRTEILLSEVSISRSGQISSSEGGIDGYNCMAHAISGATGVPFSTVDSTLASEFSYYQGNGILINDFYKATSLFNGSKGGAIIDKQGFNKLEGTNLDGKGVLVVRDINLNYHAVNAFQIFNGGIWTKEYGNSGVRDFIYTNDQIVTMYQYY